MWLANSRALPKANLGSGLKQRILPQERRPRQTLPGEPKDTVHGWNVEAIRRGFEHDQLIQEAQRRFSRNRQRGAFQNGSLTFGYSPFDGFGLINAEAAVEAVFPARKRLSQQ